MHVVGQVLADGAAGAAEASGLPSWSGVVVLAVARVARS